MHFSHYNSIDKTIKTPYFNLDKTIILQYFMVLLWYYNGIIIEFGWEEQWSCYVVGSVIKENV